MTDEQLKIADELLAYIKKNDGYTTMDGYPSELSDLNHSYQDYDVVKRRFLRQGLLEESDDESRLWIQHEGCFAARMGYYEYLKYLDKKRKDKDASEHRNAVMAKWQIITFWPMFVFATIGTASGIISLVWLLIK